jgi:hypothetical protein
MVTTAIRMRARAEAREIAAAADLHHDELGMKLIVAAKDAA